MNKQIAYVKLVSGDIFLYEIDVKYIGKKIFKFMKLSSGNCTIIEGLGRGLEVPIPDDAIVTLEQTLNDYMLFGDIKENLK